LAEAGGTFDTQIGPFPADHGIRHIRNVLDILKNLLEKPKKEVGFPLGNRDYALMFASAMVHDVGMTRMRALGADGQKATQSRLEHARQETIRSIAGPILKNFFTYQEDINRIVHVAAAHADDDRETVEDKIQMAVSNHPNADQANIILTIRPLGLADFLDIGPDRLTLDADDQRWENAQMEHLQKHRFLSAPVICENIVALYLEPRLHKDFIDASKLNLGNDEQILAPNRDPTQRRLMKCIGILHKTREDLDLMLQKLNKAARREWQLRPLDEELFGRVFPLSSGIELFSRELNTALRDRKRDELFEIDWMGHSLFQRFVQDRENLNAKFQDMLRDGELAMRVLILDPNCEGQQACEVYEAQSVLNTQGDKENRSILPLRDQKQSIVDYGDIRATLNALKGKAWNCSGRSLLELRGTSRLLYASLVRFGNRMLVTPYRDGGLFNQSGALLFTNMSPLFHAYRAEFASIWNHTEETRLFLHKAPDGLVNPVDRLLQKGHSTEYCVPSFNYERWLLKDPNRVKAWLSGKVIPPFEIEVQPTSYCGLACTHCIGRRLGPVGSASVSRLAKSDLQYFESVLKWKQGNFKVERIRISGMTGDPLEQGVCEFTKALIARVSKTKRQVVIFTNGTTLGDSSIRKVLKDVDYVHISLDAANNKTFELVKGQDVFRDILNHARSLCNEIKNEPTCRTKVGFGFVVTQQNYEEVTGAVDVARECNVDFIRFRRDIHRPDAIGWREWREARSTILRLKDNEREHTPEVCLTDIQRRHWSPHTDDCLSQRYYVTVGSDGLVYPCDHLTGMGEVCALGDLRKQTLEQIFQEASKKTAKKHLCAVGLHCSQCPPFNQRANRLLDELKVLYDQYPWNQLKVWIAQPARAVHRGNAQAR
jgi:radical SAM protein with 4Fe4S-binding SPASM domain